MSDFDLERFVQAQGSGVYERALTEIESGHKRSHWMWFIFPQLRGLGSSQTAAHYGIVDREEAAQYLAHPVLGPRLRAAARATLEGSGSSAEDVFGYPDHLKLRSSMTLFADVAGPDSIFQEVLSRFFNGEPDPRTRDLL